MTKFGALKLNRDQVMIETWLKIHTNVFNFVTALLEIIASLWLENPSCDLKTEVFLRTVWSFGDVELNKCVD